MCRNFMSSLLDVPVSRSRGGLCGVGLFEGCVGLALLIGARVRGAARRADPHISTHAITRHRRRSMHTHIHRRGRGKG